MLLKVVGEPTSPICDVPVPLKTTVPAPVCVKPLAPS